MRGQQFAARVAAFAIGAVALCGALPVRALDIEMPGERRLEIHGFYELRLRTFGENIPLGQHGFTVSQFRHVLNIETDIEIFPDGIGPLDFMLGYTRWLISYECVYQRGCSTFDSIDSYGGSMRKPVRLPRHFENARTKAPDAGGVWTLNWIPGTTQSTYQRYNPARRWRKCENPDGVYVNPAPFAFVCNSFNRSELDQPIDQFVGSQFVLTRAGAVNAQILDNLVTAGRAQINRNFQGKSRSFLIAGEEVERTGNAVWQQLDDLAALDRIRLNGEAIALTTAATLTEAELLGTAKQNPVPQQLLQKSVELQNAADATDDPTVKARLEKASEQYEGAYKILFPRDNREDPDEIYMPSADPNSEELVLVPRSESKNANNAMLLAARPDNNRFPTIDIGNGAGITEAIWGASQFKKGSLRWRTNIDGPIRPQGYMMAPTLDVVSEVSMGLADDLNLQEDDPVLLRNLETKEKADQVAFFVGPDRITNTADDLPTTRCPPGTSSQGDFLGARCIDDATEEVVEPLYYIAPDGQGGIVGTGLSQQDCKSIMGQENGGVNANGECVIPSNLGRVSPIFNPTNPTQIGVPTIVAAKLLRDPVFRPAEAVQEGTVLTDYRLQSQDQFLPARPVLRDNGLYYITRGVQTMYDTSHSVISALDMDFSEDELRWEHGASQDEHEFREGYLEFEFMDSQVFTRIGKLLMVWGKTELFRNADRLNPVDIGFGTLSRLEESRIGQWALDMTFSPEAWMQVGPVQDLRMELAVVFDNFEPTDIGKCGESLAFELVCGKLVGAEAAGLLGLGLVGEINPYNNESGIKRWDYGIRFEGRWNRFTFAISDFYGWDDSFILEPVHIYGRRVDSVTGAPVNVNGPLDCKFRGADGSATSNQLNSVGPDGVPGTGDEATPSVGNCLLYDNPVGDGPQLLRSRNDISLDHYANQTLFHTVCTLTFDEDTGQCALDSLNDASLFVPISNALAGSPLIAGIALANINQIRFQSDDPVERLTVTDKQLLERTLEPINPGVRLIDMQPEQQALLGCGPRFASSCGQGGGAAFGGVDFMNADASILMQEFSYFKATQGGALIGTRGAPLNRIYFEAGVTTAGMSAPDATNLGINATRTAQERAAADMGVAFEDLPNFDCPNPPCPETGIISKNDFATDFQIEPQRWNLDQEAADRGILLFEDPRVIDEETGEPTGALDLDKLNPLGENCTPLYGGPDPGCTELEIMSANLERFLIGSEILGGDRAFDPPESLTEILVKLDGDPSNDPFGDPFSGPDGNVFNNFDANGDGDISHTGVEEDQYLIRAAGGALLAVDEFAECQNITQNTCYRNLGEPFSDPTDPEPVKQGFSDLIGNLPWGMRFQIQGRLVSTGTPVNLGTRMVNIQALTPEQLQRLLVQGELPLDELDLDITPPSPAIVLDKLIDNRPGGTSDFTQLVSARRDLNQDGVADLDQDQDGLFDFADDGVVGPVTDDNFMCGTGLPGDPLQEAAQYDLSPNDEALLASTQIYAGFDGLPPRSPVFCQGITGLVNATGQTLKYVRAGGDSRFGRRDFLWHGGRQLQAAYQKKNVFAIGLDFAEDRTKTSWGIEFSWINNKQFTNGDAYDGLTPSDQMVLSISMDRPTFFNFLNPNRSFFINVQMFWQYFANYKGGSDDKDGFYTQAQSKLSPGWLTLTVFTGYFQDRLNPRFTLVWDTTTSTYGLLTGVGYRWNEAFSTGVTWNSFWGAENVQQGGYFPASLYGSGDTHTQLFRGFAAVRNRDVFAITFRYTF